MIYAPVIIPTLNRLDHLSVCLESLSRCSWAENTEVFVALDFPPNKKYEEGYKKVKNYLDNCGNMNFKQLHIIKRETNYGVVRNFRDLQSIVFQKFDRLILCDDDVEFSVNFLQYMDLSLEKYNCDENVVAVTGYAYPISWRVSDGATCFKQKINGSDWGLGLWREKYHELLNYFNNDVLSHKLKDVIEKKTYLRMIDACKKEYFNHACGFKKRNKANDYWRLPVDITMRCYTAVEDKYILAPVLSKLKNHGFDGSGVICQAITDNFGDKAWNYDYEHQPIDEANHFELIEDSLHDEVANRDLLNSFDSRTPEEMKRTYKLIWLCEHVGCWAGKLYAKIMNPIDIICILYDRYVNK